MNASDTMKTVGRSGGQSTAVNAQQRHFQIQIFRQRFNVRAKCVPTTRIHRVER